MLACGMKQLHRAICFLKETCTCQRYFLLIRVISEQVAQREGLGISLVNLAYVIDPGVSSVLLCYHLS
jgi:hypothetical protein